MSSVSFFFFQAEDGIRDLVRSRGLGDVYKRQAQNSVLVQQAHYLPPAMIAAQIDAVLSDYRAAAIKTGFLGRGGNVGGGGARLRGGGCGSYTHLTPPTSGLV